MTVISSSVTCFEANYNRNSPKAIDSATQKDFLTLSEHIKRFSINEEDSL